MALTAVFWLRLMERVATDNKGATTDRTNFVKNTIECWKALSPRAPPQARAFAPPTEDEWKALRHNEFRACAELFVGAADGISLNEAMSENVWATYTCVVNGIHLWIIGRPGTSKSLAVNTVLKKLFVRQSSNRRLASLPPLVYQMYMCSLGSTSEAILEQLNKIVARGRRESQDGFVIQVQILEEMGHADMSPHLPLKCLHNVIDNGIEYANDVRVKPVLVGLSNYNMDRAKLNRGILIYRDLLNQDQLTSTAKEIAASTVIDISGSRRTPVQQDAAERRVDTDLLVAWSELYEKTPIIRTSRFVGYRDFYGVIRGIADIFFSQKPPGELVTRVFLRNLSGIPPEHNRGYQRELANTFFGHQTAKRICRTAEPPPGALDISGLTVDNLSD
jgi:hypothetical protein